MKNGDLLVGVRFKGKAKMRAGVDGTVVIDEFPVSGPIMLHEMMSYPDGTPVLRVSKYAACLCCGETSKVYERNGPGLKRWAHAHRCHN
jgi:hypothetical protein